MKAEMAVRSISASISACAARMAPRMISSVTGSQDALPLDVFPWADRATLEGALPGASFWRSMGRVLDGDECHRITKQALRQARLAHLSGHTAPGSPRALRRRQGNAPRPSPVS